jgi:hypothetical protein
MFHQEDLYVSPKPFTWPTLVKTQEDTKKSSLAKVKNFSKISNLLEAYKSMNTCVDFCKGSWRVGLQVEDFPPQRPIYFEKCNAH